MHEGFAGIAEWNGFLNGADRVYVISYQLDYSG